MGDRLKSDVSSVSSIHMSMIQRVIGSRDDASQYLLYSYRRSFSGFVAKLTNEEKQKLAAMEGVVSVFLSQKKKLHTTRSWDFIGFPMNVTRTKGESNIIIGMLDSGIWPESASFNDPGFGPPPSKWKGTCQDSSNFTCNNKIIGARYYDTEGNDSPGASPRDSEGHGSHTSSIAAGDIVYKASLLGLGPGTARGGVPTARIAVYKVCWFDSCTDADILAGFDDAIADGVDIISVSIGGSALEYFQDSIAIGSFHSMKNGILTSNSAGNDGPQPQTISNCSPWSLSVAASTIDRKFVTQVILGNGATYEGLSVNTFDLGNTTYPIIYGGNAPNLGPDSRYCYYGSLNSTLVDGKIVLCDAVTSGLGAMRAGAVGAIMRDGFYKDFARSFPLPVSDLSSSARAFDISEYLNSTSEPTARILKSIEGKDELAPYAASFSSRGPNPITNDILKPDIAAPGVDILAAWSEATTVTGYVGDTRVVPYNIISGTSMACPHATAAAAYVKSFHPAWSPAAIKSALMTTSSIMSPQTNPDAEFAYGSGHINPVNAISPGLVYDIGEIEYIQFLCGQGYNTTQIQLVTGNNNITCSESTNATVWDLNYPSFAMSTQPGNSVTRIFRRTMMNVGSSTSTYKATMYAPTGLNVHVSPEVLSFDFLGQKQSFVLTIETRLSQNQTQISGSLIWDDGVHNVRSPIIAFASV